MVLLFRRKGGHVSDQEQERRRNDLCTPDDGVRTVISASSGREIADYEAAGKVAPDVVVLTGYVGGGVEDGDAYWLLLYADDAFHTWTLVRTDDVCHRDWIHDDKLPFRGYDVIWVKRSARVSRGSGADTAAQQRLITGKFTAAADLDPAPRGGSALSISGVDCGARSARPNCSGA